MSAGLALALLFALGWIPAYLFRAESVSAALPVYSRAERLWVRASIAVLVIHVSAACLSLSLTPRVDTWRAALGVGVFAAGMGLWLWARVLIGPLRVRRMPDDAPAELRRNGPFALVRHPLYLGVLLGASAPILVAPRASLGVTLSLCFVVLAVRAEQEERRLRTQLGAMYEDYCRAVKRLVPFVW
jgi:protein-S-isoprenylcysteine O-methyltransferase Ste14